MLRPFVGFSFALLMLGSWGCFDSTPSGVGKPGEDEPPHVLVGKTAPPFDSTTLDGASIRLSDLSGQVVVLDFWATWCPPCIRALPKVAETAAQYKDKGVVFYAVNQGEGADVIKEFLSAQGLSVPVALDVDSKISQAYVAEAIPQTVIIDKQGKIQVVHVGAGPNIGAELAHQLDEVLAGKDLASETLKK